MPNHKFFLFMYIHSMETNYSIASIANFESSVCNLHSLFRSFAAMSCNTVLSSSPLNILTKEESSMDIIALFVMSTVRHPLQNIWTAECIKELWLISAKHQVLQDQAVSEASQTCWKKNSLWKFHSMYQKTWKKWFLGKPTRKRNLNQYFCCFCRVLLLQENSHHFLIFILSFQLDNFFIFSASW